VGGKYTKAADRLRIPLLDLPAQVAAQLKLHQSDGQKRGVTFIHVIDDHVIVQGFENAHTADSQNGFLAQTIIRIPTIEVIGKFSIAGVILGQIRVEQKYRDGMPANSFEIVSPCTDHHGAILNRYLDYRVFYQQ
jgi:hypothetical protein